MLIISFIWRLISLKSHGLRSGKSKSLLVGTVYPTYLLRSKESNKKLDAFISASAVNYGAVNGEEICTETTVMGEV
jgi:hypothetical protein